jgi:MFS transporter, FSR family, fosmidomycin resistance protein
MVDRRQMTLLAVCHAAADVCQAAVPALLPFLVAQRGFSYAEASLLVLAATISSSILQPAFGHWSDQRPAPWLMPAGLALGGLGIAALGFVDGVPAAVLVVLVSCLGVAAFHPECSRAASYAAGERRATGMSFFSVGGNLGWALGPLLVVATVLPLGLAATPLVALPPLVAAVVMALALPELRATRVRVSAERARLARSLPGGGRDDWRGFALLTLAVAARSVLYFGVVTFVPLYFVDELGRGEAHAELAITVFLLAGALGTLLGGPLADRVGRRPVLLVSFCLQVPLLLAFLAADAAAATVLLAEAQGPKAPLEALVVLPLLGLAAIAALGPRGGDPRATLPRPRAISSVG